MKNEIKVARELFQHTFTDEMKKQFELQNECVRLKKQWAPTVQEVQFMKDYGETDEMLSGDSFE